jgi:hypothetical protein
MRTAKRRYIAALPIWTFYFREEKEELAETSEGRGE